MKWKFSQAYLQFFQFQKRFTITVTHSFNTTIPKNSNTTLYVLVNLHVLRIYMYLSVLHQFLNWSVWRFLRSTPTKLPSPSIRTAIIFFSTMITDNVQYYSVVILNTINLPLTKGMRKYCCASNRPGCFMCDCRLMKWRQ